MHSGDLNNELVRLVGIQIMEICSIVEWFAIQMPDQMSVHYSDHYLVNGLVFKPLFEYRCTIQMPWYQASE